MDILLRVRDPTLTFPPPKQFYYYKLKVFLYAAPVLDGLMTYLRTTTIIPPQLLSLSARPSFPRLLVELGKAHPAPGHPTR